MPPEVVRMSRKELSRADVIARLARGELTAAAAGVMLGRTRRQVVRVLRRFRAEGPGGLASQRRGKPSNNRVPEAVRREAVALVREHYPDFGPTLAAEKLAELHGIRLSRETLRSWMKAEGLWLDRTARRKRAFQPRPRRECFGELIQIDGCTHWWFEDRGSRCTLLVFVDDATGRLMELRFVQSESAFDYFAALRSYLGRFGRPVAFYSDKASIFRAYSESNTGPAKRVTQFARALEELNIDIICANSPQAKGRVERVHQTLQDRLVKELRLAGVGTLEAANAFVPRFVEDYNRRFARAPYNAHDAHRALGSEYDLNRILTWQEERVLSRNLVVHFKRATYVVEPTPERLALGGRRIRVHEHEDGTVELWHGEELLPYSVLEAHRLVHPGDVVESKSLDAVLAVIRRAQEERAHEEMASGKLTLRERSRLACKLDHPGPTYELVSQEAFDAVSESMRRLEEDGRARRRKHNLAAAARRKVTSTAGR